MTAVNFSIDGFYSNKHEDFFFFDSYFESSKFLIDFLNPQIALCSFHLENFES